MTKPAAKDGDGVGADKDDIHIENVPGPGGPTPTPTPHNFSGSLTSGFCPTVIIEHRHAAVVGTEATNDPPHVPKSGPFVNPPEDRGVIVGGSATVLMEHRHAARSGDPVKTCDESGSPDPKGHVSASSTVLIAD